MDYRKERSENIDLLRLIAMIFIVCIHYVGWGAASSRNITFFNLAFTGGVAVACNNPYPMLENALHPNIG